MFNDYFVAYVCNAIGSIWSVWGFNKSRLNIVSFQPGKFKIHLNKPGNVSCGRSDQTSVLEKFYALLGFFVEFLNSLFKNTLLLLDVLKLNGDLIRTI